VKKLISLGAAVGGLFILLAIAARGAKDRTVFVSPPEAVAENFIRAVITHRYDPALKYLEPGLSRTTGKTDLAALANQISSHAGKVVRVDAEQTSINGDLASARVIVHGTAPATETINLALSFSQGSWRIERMRFAS
jgi:hypothetical protein